MATKRKYVAYGQLAQPIQRQTHLRPRLDSLPMTKEEEFVIKKGREVGLVTYFKEGLTIQGDKAIKNIAIHAGVKHEEMVNIFLDILVRQDRELGLEMLSNYLVELEKIVAQGSINLQVDTIEGLRENIAQHLQHEGPWEKEDVIETVLEPEEIKLTPGQRLAGKAVVYHERVVRNDGSRH